MSQLVILTGIMAIPDIPLPGTPAWRERPARKRTGLAAQAVPVTAG